MQTRFLLDVKKFEKYADECAEIYNTNKEEKGEEFADSEQFKGITKALTSRSGGHFKSNREDRPFDDWRKFNGDKRGQFKEDWKHKYDRDAPQNDESLKQFGFGKGDKPVFMNRSKNPNYE